MTKTYSVGYNHDAKSPYKNGAKRSNRSGHYVEESTNLIGKELFGAKTRYFSGIQFSQKVRRSLTLSYSTTESAHE